MFSEELDKYSWEETTEKIYSKTTADAEAAPESFAAIFTERIDISVRRC